MGRLGYASLSYPLTASIRFEPWGTQPVTPPAARPPSIDNRPHSTLSALRFPTPPGRLGSPLARQKIQAEQSRSALGIKRARPSATYAGPTTPSKLEYHGSSEDSVGRTRLAVFRLALSFATPRTEASGAHGPLNWMDRFRPSVGRCASVQLSTAAAEKHSRATDAQQKRRSSQGSPCVSLHRPLRGSDSRGVSGPQSKDTD